MIKVQTLDMANANGYVITEFDVVKKALQIKKKYSKDLLYRGFNAQNIPLLLKEGKDNLKTKYLYCSSEEDITDKRADGTLDVFKYADFDNPAIAVFNPEYLEEKLPYAYKFKDKNKKLEAIVAIFKLNYPNY